MTGRKSTVNHWFSESQEASAQGKKVLENGLRPREAPGFPSVYQSSRKAAAITALNIMYISESQVVSTRGGHFTRGRVLSSSPHWWALYFFTSAMYLAHASPLLVNTSSSVFCFLATIPVLRASLFPPLRLPTWVKGQKTARVTGAGPALGGAEAHYTFLATPRPAPPAGRPAQQSERSTLDSAPALGCHAQAVLGPRLPSQGARGVLTLLGIGSVLSLPRPHPVLSGTTPGSNSFLY